jgi:hypothetical protein
MPDKKAMAQAAGSYLKRHPEELLRVVRNAIGLRVGLPLDALRWLASQAKGKRAPREVRLEAVPPGIRASAIVHLAGSDVRASATLFVEKIRLAVEELRFDLRLADVKLELVDPSAETPIATLIKSGALDLSKPGNLAAFMPKRPPVLVDAHDDRIAIDLMKHPKLAANGKLGRIVETVTALVTVRAIETESEHLDVQLTALPRGVAGAVAAIRPGL